jgi:hypothetical protein
LYYLESNININVFAESNRSIAYYKSQYPEINVSYEQFSVLDSSSIEINLKDYRAIVLDEYFKRNNSPLYGLGKNFVEACDKYNAPKDCTTLPAIGFVETGLCTYKPSQGQKNCWGWGGSGPNRIIFDDYPQAIDTITRRLVAGYGNNFISQPIRMQYIYCGPNCHSWGNGVEQQRKVMNNIAKELGYPPMLLQ